MRGTASRLRSRCRLAILVLLAGQAAGATAQQPVPIKGRLEPYLGSLGRDYPVVGVAFRSRQPPDASVRAPYARELYLAVGATRQAGVKAQADVRVPALGPHDRLTVALSLSRRARTLFPGLGNEAEFDRAFEKHGHRDYYSVRRNRATIRIEGTRWLRGGFGVAVRLGLDAAAFTALPNASVFRATYGASLQETDATAGVVALYDRRDSEAIATRGVLLEAGIGLGGGAGSYRRGFGMAQGYLPLTRSTGLALRGLIAGLSGTPPLLARFEVPVWERSLAVFGGDDSHRGLPGGRLLGSGVWLVNAEVRQDVGLVRRQTVSVIGLVDAGRVFESEPVRLTADGAHLSVGVAVALRGRRQRLGAGLAAIGPDGLRLSLVSGWPF